MEKVLAELIGSIIGGLGGALILLGSMWVLTKMPFFKRAKAERERKAAEFQRYLDGL